MNRFKRFLAFFMAVIMTFCTFSFNALADEKIVNDSTTKIDDSSTSSTTQKDESTTDESTSETTTSQEDTTTTTSTTVPPIVLPDPVEPSTDTPPEIITNPPAPLDPEIVVPGGSEGEGDETTQEDTELTEDEIIPESTQEELDNQEQDLETKLNETENQLVNLSEDDEQYMLLLDQKIGYINAQLMLYDNQILAAKSNIEALQKEIDPLLAETQALEDEYNLSKEEYDNLSLLFRSTYDKYCNRIKALYVTGATSVISVLLSSEDLSQFLTRLEFITIITKKDGDFMQQVEDEMQTLVEKQNGLTEQKEALDVKTDELVSKLENLQANQDSITEKQEKIAQKKLELSQARAKFPFLTDDGGSLFYNSNEVLNLTYPVPNQHHLSLGYGYYSSGKPHRALDFPLTMGAPVVAAQKGIVLKAVDLGNRSYGRYVMIYHGTDVLGRQIVTLYAHNSELLVTPGQTVAKGQQIAKGGSTGNSTGPHCHFELRVDKKLVNPTYFLS